MKKHKIKRIKLPKTGIIHEFKEFAIKGNVIDLAIGVIIGSAFGKITTSLVNDIIMPAISVITGRINLSEMSVTIPAALEEGSPIQIMYGMFLQNVLDFFIIAISVFMVVKLINKLKKTVESQVEKSAEPATPPPPPPPPPAQELLLAEIRDLLKESTGNKVKDPEGDDRDDEEADEQE